MKRHDLVVARHHVSLSIENGEGFFDMVILGIFLKNPWCSEKNTFLLLNDIAVKLFSCSRDAGFRPGSRGPFVSTEGPKTIDAPPGHIRVDGRKPKESGPTRCTQTRPAEG